MFISRTMQSHCRTRVNQSPELLQLVNLELSVLTLDGVVSKYLFIIIIIATLIWVNTAHILIKSVYWNHKNTPVFNCSSASIKSREVKWVCMCVFWCIQRRECMRCFNCVMILQGAPVCMLLCDGSTCKVGRVYSDSYLTVGAFHCLRAAWLWNVQSTAFCLVCSTYFCGTLHDTSRNSFIPIRTLSVFQVFINLEKLAQCE